MIDLRYALVTFLISVTLIVHSAIGQGYPTGWIDGTPRFHDESVQLLKLAKFGNKPILAPSTTAAIPDPAYKVGDTKQFYATNAKTNTQYLLTATLSAVSDKAYIFVENGDSVSADNINSLLTSFADTYDKLTKQFGNPPNRFSNDPRIYLLILNIQGASLGNGQRIIGYFSAIDQFSNVELSQMTNKRSNEADLLYIDSISLSSSSIDVRSVVGHEFTHLIQWGEDPEESTWVDEGLAVYAEYFLGFNVKDRIAAYENNQDVSLINWAEAVESYGAAFLFFAYISERFGGPDTVAAIMKDDKQDTVGVEDALAQLGKVVTFNDIFSDWTIANYLDDPNVYGGIYGYSTLDVKLKSSVVETQYPINEKSDMVLPWSARYIEFQRGSNAQLDLTVFNESQGDINSRLIDDTNASNVIISTIISNKAASGNISVAPEQSQVLMVITSQPDPPDSKQNISDYTYSAITTIKGSNISISILGAKITTWGNVKQN
jgi:hypothetical protein